jgi:hypothetical protein
VPEYRWGGHEAETETSEQPTALPLLQSRAATELRLLCTATVSAGLIIRADAQADRLFLKALLRSNGSTLFPAALPSVFPRPSLRRGTEQAHGCPPFVRESRPKAAKSNLKSSGAFQVLLDLVVPFRMAYRPTFPYEPEGREFESLRAHHLCRRF